jgi:hypothetical protein
VTWWTVSAPPVPQTPYGVAVPSGTEVTVQVLFAASGKDRRTGLLLMLHPPPVRVPVGHVACDAPVTIVLSRPSGSSWHRDRKGWPLPPGGSGELVHPWLAGRPGGGVALRTWRSLCLRGLFADEWFTMGNQVVAWCDGIR